MNTAANLPEQTTIMNRTFDGIKNTFRFTKSVLYLTRKVFML
ncbi:hypothetical protein [Lacinutrix sp. Hel_I_90]|nr:hypothetical protein [Lacinutrix sp. Hel_I_90]